MLAYPISGRPSPRLDGNRLRGTRKVSEMQVNSAACDDAIVQSCKAKHALVHEEIKDGG